MLKKHNNPTPQVKVDDICDRIFELVDVNNDGKLVQDYTHGCGLQ